MNKVLVLPYKTASESATAVSGILNCMKMKVEGSQIRNLATTTIVNWGNSTTDLSRLTSVKVFNKPINVRTASHKLEFFQAISEANEGASLPVCIPDWTTSVTEARRWYSDGHDVVCRHVMQGHSGDGIELVNYRENITATDAVPNAPLYTKYVKKRDEYRVHVVKGTAIFVQRKGREFNNENPVNYQIRNRANGFIFLTQDLNPHKTVISEAVNTVNALGLDFGAVDVIWNERRKVATVLEVNTACGLTSPLSKQRYTLALNTMITGVGKQISWQQATDSDEVLTFDPNAYRVHNSLRGHILSSDSSEPHLSFYRNYGTGPELTATIGSTTEEEVTTQQPSAMEQFQERLNNLENETPGNRYSPLSIGDNVQLSPALILALNIYCDSNPHRASFREWRRAINNGVHLIYQVQSQSVNSERLHIRFTLDRDISQQYGFSIPFPRNQIRLIQPRDSNE